MYKCFFCIIDADYYHDDTLYDLLELDKALPAATLGKTAEAEEILEQVEAKKAKKEKERLKKEKEKEKERDEKRKAKEAREAVHTYTILTSRS